VIAQSANGEPRGRSLDSHKETTDKLAALRDQVELQAVVHRSNQAATERCLGEQQNLLATVSSNVEIHLEQQDAEIKQQATLLSTLSTAVDDGLVRQDSSLQRITALVARNQESLHRLQSAMILLFVCLMSMMKVMGRMLENIPQRMLMNNAVIFEDAHAFKYPIYTQFMDSWDVSARAPSEETHILITSVRLSSSYLQTILNPTTNPVTCVSLERCSNCITEPTDKRFRSSYRSPRLSGRASMS